ncbi:MAG: hypothetical protein A4E28_02718 [Methanocella sp. PtaU1.Bin125]|nr:MAG: hypothetical protein A4E28_02718 [Methanocella sp. PtaU1.Bin125]
MQLWRFHRKTVGMWVIESNRSLFRYPLEPGADRSEPAREYFNYMQRALDAAADLLSVRYVESPPGHAIMKSYVQLIPAEIRQELSISWEAEARETGRWIPAALFGGLSRIHVKENTAVLPVEIPDALRLCLVASEDRYLLTLVTNCDLWMDRFISGEDNAEAGSLNASALGRTIGRLENAMDGRVVSYSSEMGVPISESGFR